MTEPTTSQVQQQAPQYGVGDNMEPTVGIAAEQKISPAMREKVLRDQLISTPKDLKSDQPQKAYVTDPETPNLPQAEENLDPETQTLKHQPYKLAERQTIRQHLTGEFAKIVQDYAKSQGRELSDEELENIVKKFEKDPDNPEFDEADGEMGKYAREQAFANIKKKYNLPPSWSAGSNKASDWAPLTSYGGGGEKAEPYSPKEQGAINQAYEQNLENAVKTQGATLSPEEQKVLLEMAKNPKNAELAQQYPNLVDLAKTARTNALAETQATYSLDATWTPGTTDPTKWSPVQATAINPQMRASNHSNNVLNSSMQLSEEQMQLTNEVLSLVPDIANGKISSDQVMVTVLKALQKLKEFLYETGSPQDAKRIEALSDDRVEMVKQNMNDIEEQRKLAEKNADKAVGMKVLQGAMIAVGAILTIVGAVLSPFSLGGTIALVVVGAVMIGVGVANMATGFMDKGIQELMTFIADGIGEIDGIDPAAAKALSAAILTIAAIVIIAVIIVASAGQASSTAGQIAGTVGRQLAVGLGAMVISSTASEMVVQSMKASPDADVREFAKENEGWIRMIVSLIVAIIAIGVTVGANKGNLKMEGPKGGDQGGSAIANAMSKVKPGSAKMLGRATEYTKYTGEALAVSSGAAAGGMQISSAVTQKEQDVMEADIQERNALIKMINTLIDRLSNAQQGNMKTIQSADQAQKHFLKSQSQMTNRLWQA